METVSWQVELLETLLLSYKDFVHQPKELLKNAHLLHDCGFGLRQNSKVSLVEGAGLFQRHIGSVVHHYLSTSHHHTITPSQAPIFSDTCGSM